MLFGPTAVGKTALLNRLARLGIEIINADSMQVYRHMDIGTAKPDPETLRRVPHHLIDIKEPDQQFSVGEFVRRADEVARDIAARGAIPVVAGGTAFYVRHFLTGLPESPPQDPQVRCRLQGELADRGPAALFRELEQVDGVYAAKIGPEDRQRILRALEIYRLTGRPVSSFPVPNQPRDDFHFLLIGLDRDREELYRRIEHRVDHMFREGLVHEVKELKRRGYTESDPGMQAIGYREFFQMERSGCITLTDVRDLIVRNSRRYAKRQITFFRRFKRVQWFHPDAYGRIASLVGAFVARARGGDDGIEPDMRAAPE